MDKRKFSLLWMVLPLIMLVTSCQTQLSQTEQTASTVLATVQTGVFPTEATTETTTTIQPVAQSTETPAPKPTVDFPFDISKKILTPTKIADLSNINGMPHYQMAEDGQGNLHVVWGSWEGIWQRQLGPDGVWSALATITSAQVNEGNFQLITDPNGRACVLWMESIKEEYHFACQQGKEWVSVIEGQVGLKSIKDTAQHIASFEADFDSTGHLQVVAFSWTKGLFQSDRKLFPDEDTSNDSAYFFNIDTQGMYILAYIHFDSSTKTRTPVLKTSSDHGKTWQKHELTPDTKFGGGYAELGKGIFYHISVFRSGYVGVWMSGQGAIQAEPLFDGKAMFNKALKDFDLRYNDLTNYNPSALISEPYHGLQFVADGEGLSYIRLEKNNRWTIQKIQSEGSNPVLYIGKNGKVFFLWRTLKAIFFASL